MNLDEPFESMDPQTFEAFCDALFGAAIELYTADGCQVFGKPIYDRVPEDP